MHCAYPTQARAMKSPVNEKTIDTLSVLSDRTLCASPEPVEPPPCFARIPCAPTPLSKCAYPAYAVRANARAIAGIAFVLWSVNISLSLVEYFREPFPLLRSATH